MFLAHSIRLRHPWKFDLLADGVTRCTRTFHKPTGLEPDDDLWLVLSGLPPKAQVTVNGHTFAPRGGESFATSDSRFNDAHQSQKIPDPFRLPARFNLTLILTETNRIEILLPAAYSLQPTASPPFDARLAIMARS